MYQFVFLQLVQLCEIFPAQRAPIDAFSFVNRQVRAQGPGVREGLFANIALPRPLACMGRAMPLQHARMIEGLIAKVALVRPLLLVVHPVRLQVDLQAEPLPAHFALEPFLAVGERVSVQRADVLEALAANLAQVEFFHGRVFLLRFQFLHVVQPVPVEDPRVVERLPARVALVGLLSGVG